MNLEQLQVYAGVMCAVQLSTSSFSTSCCVFFSPLVLVGLGVLSDFPEIDSICGAQRHQGQAKPSQGVSPWTLKLTSTFPFFVPEPVFGRLAAIVFNKPSKGLSHTPLPDPTRHADDFPVGLSVTLTFGHCLSLWPLLTPFIPGVYLMLLLLQNPSGHFLSVLVSQGAHGVVTCVTQCITPKAMIFFIRTRSMRYTIRFSEQKHIRIICT